MRAGELIDGRSHSLLCGYDAVCRCGFAIVCGMGPVAGPCLTVSRGARTVGSCSYVHVVPCSLAVLGKLVSGLRSVVAGRGCLVVGFGSLVPDLRGPVPAFAGLVGLGSSVVISGAASMFLTHPAQNTSQAG